VGSVFGSIRFLLPVCRLCWFLYTLNIYANFSSHFSQQLLMTGIWYFPFSYKRVIIIFVIKLLLGVTIPAWTRTPNIYTLRRPNTKTKYFRTNKMNCELMFTYDTPALRQTGSVTIFSATIDGRNLIFGHKLHVRTPYRGKRFWTHQIPTSCCRLCWFLYTLNIYAHFSSHFSQQLLMAEIWYLVTSFI
jgi:hypothetical protein